VLLQPGHQRQVVGNAAQQGHRVVRVRVDQARHQRSLGSAHHLGGAEACARLGTRQDGHDLAATHGNGMVFQHHRMRLDRNDVTGFDEQVAGFGEVRAIAHAGSLAGGGEILGDTPLSQGLPRSGGVWRPVGPMICRSRSWERQRECDGAYPASGRHYRKVGYGRNLT
jgi:hypothetical protein